ncbi:protein REPRESSOR OF VERNALIZATION 1-like [Bidens hawaiensis]|uniref:protein REPRESSOR OF VERNALIZATION 1-like n=1 Tax=Bidens hawaiensis TaxID=980011 RepID=UPI00404B10FF
MAKKSMLNKGCSADITSDNVAQPVQDAAKPTDGVLKISGEGSNLKKHYKEFEFNGNTYELGDTVLLAADSQGQLVKPYVAIIKNETGCFCDFLGSGFLCVQDITAKENKEITLNAQWFYRPDEVTPGNGKSMESLGTRELYYSLHMDEVHAETVIHKCIVHFVTEQNHIPPRKKYPGFIVMKVYNPSSNMLTKLTNSFLHPDRQQ